MEKRIGFEIKTLSHLINLNLRNNELNISSSQGYVIVLLSNNNDQMNQNDLNRHICCRRSSITSLINNLEKDGFIGRRKDFNDKRVNIIYLTDKGKKYSKILKDNIDNNEKILESSITEEEKELLFTILDKLKKSMEVNQ